MTFDFIRIADDVDCVDIQSGLRVLTCPRVPVLCLPGREWQSLLDAIGTGIGLQRLEERLRDEIAPERIQAMVGFLSSRLFLTGGSGDSALAIYGTPVPLPASIRVRLDCVGRVDFEACRNDLAACGIMHDENAALHVVLTDDYLRPELAAFNESRLTDRHPWLLARLGGLESWQGPLFVPGQGPCWACFESRHQDRHQTRRYLGRCRGIPMISERRAQSPATRAATLAVLAPLLERFVATGEHAPFSSHIRSSNFSDGTIGNHLLVRRPQCPACGDPRAAIPQPIGRLDRAEWPCAEHPSDETVEPTITFERYAHHLSPVTGIGDKLIEAHPDDVILCYGVTKSDTRVLSSPAALIPQRILLQTGTGWGKGLTHLQARVGALCETIERFTFMDERPRDYRRASLEELGTTAVDPRTVLQFSEAQYRKLGSGVGHDRIPGHRFDPSRTIGWTAGWSLTSSEERLVASDQMWMTALNTRDADFCIADSNGCAAGNTLREATLRGLLELIERDSVAIWWYNRLVMPAVDLGDPRLADVRDLQRHYAQHYHRDFWVLDLTGDLGIPVYTAVSARRDSRYPEYVACFGCHLDPLIAIRHAVTELGMMMAGWKPFLTCRDHEVDAGPSSTAWPDHIRRWLREVSVDDQPQMRPAADKAPHALLSSLPAQALASLPAQALGFDGLSVCLERLAAAAMDVVVVDATRPDIGMPVVRVLAPGLRHFRPRFAPGRLFDIPVIRGLRDRPLLEEELNPIPLVF